VNTMQKNQSAALICPELSGQLIYG
jgi:hypothetical protein